MSSTTGRWMEYAHGWSHRGEAHQSLLGLVDICRPFFLTAGLHQQSGIQTLMLQLQTVNGLDFGSGTDAGTFAGKIGKVLHCTCCAMARISGERIWLDKLNAQVHACNSDCFSHHFGTPLKVSCNRWDGTGFCVKDSSDDHGLCLLPTFGRLSIVNHATLPLLHWMAT